MAKCPVCIIDLGAKIPTFCPQCRWETGRDLTLISSLNITPSEVTEYRERLENHKAIWRMMLESKKHASEKEAQIKREQKRANELQEQLKQAEQENKEVEIKAKTSKSEAETETQLDEKSKNELHEKLKVLQQERDKNAIKQQELEDRIQKKLKASEKILVEGGSFIMGSKKKFDILTFILDKDIYDKEFKHKVTLSSYYIGKNTVTVNEYRAYCLVTGKRMPNEPKWGWNDNDPIVGVNWHEAKAYCEWVGCRLPTEAEWEYAARGGNKSKGYIYSGSDNLNDVSWNAKNSNSKVHPVGTKQPNELGINDMSGNVWEWCSDWYDENYYRNSSKNNPKGPGSGSFRVLRGGSWDHYDDYCRVANRYRDNPDYMSYGGGDSGFRVVQD